jgi:hypothetical protein
MQTVALNSLQKKSKTSSPNTLKEFKFNLTLGPTPEYKAIFYFGFYRFNNAYVGPLHTTNKSNSLIQSFFWTFSIVCFNEAQRFGSRRCFLLQAVNGNNSV